ncbi:methyl-accepting chemotaxis protein-2 (aspartate sensor receptor) [Paraburkholderia eburnea]|uniref:Methyl-accepting chemotaxis protein-2 (Aspartate sensor receptor) n=1 Tax=Paraburkholderia eburnea TaxID=1189126 RepID=A0A2S4M8R2_9BURK|nr:methyl-accepting chemotaxis protein [Paraburkholderia eburnea]POR51005.1 methyl-accepting chemotaxis protein-2 (aspartate sensor receptor) [Paraburkholderia eburnea]PRZ21740.1 methyl-accepting chemotaxis protein-2 (aspartate sensor receptor) [Paraburkholderia eburnea]
MLSFVQRRTSVGVRLALLSCVIVAAIFIAFTLALTNSAATQVGEQVRARIAEKDQAVASTIALIDSALDAEVDRSMTLFASFLPGDFALDPTQTVDIGGKATPTFKVGDHVLNLDFSIPDQFLSRSGAIATVFARSGDDFVRVTTSLKKQDGSRAIGTLLDRKGPAYEPILGGRSYAGLAQLFGKQYITEYKPITDASGKVIGALFVGVDVDRQIEAIKTGIGKLRLGDTGYYFVMDASSGAARGTFLVHPAAAGKHFDDANAPYTRMLDAREGTFDYTSADATLGEHDPRAKLVSFVSAPQWQWLVGGVVPRDEIMAEVNATRNRFAAIGFALVVLFAALAIFAARRMVSQPLDAAAHAAGRLAAGDLTVRIGAAQNPAAPASEGADEIGRLTQAIDGIGVGLAQIVAQVRGASAQMSDDTGRIAASSGEIAERIASQASSLEETAASMEEITSTVQQNADHAQRANAVVTGAADAALDGGRAVERVVATMQDISRASQKITDITGVIDGIAFQTNILALNAAVEAARAGEHGRGFAVVASEVRALAQRSAAAAREIAALIAESSETVDAGYRIAGEASTTMRDIVTRVEEVRAIIAEISVASREQSGGIEQVNIAVSQIGEATQQNAVLVGDAERAAAALSEQAATLAQLVSVFKLRGER